MSVPTIRVPVFGALLAAAPDDLRHMMAYLFVRLLEIDGTGAREWIALQAAAHLDAERLRALGASAGTWPPRDTLPCAAPDERDTEPGT